MVVFQGGQRVGDLEQRDARQVARGGLDLGDGLGRVPQRLLDQPGPAGVLQE